MVFAVTMIESSRNRRCWKLLMQKTESLLAAPFVRSGTICSKEGTLIKSNKNPSRLAEKYLLLSVKFATRLESSIWNVSNYLQ